jgi:hypothetical protein
VKVTVIEGDADSLSIDIDAGSIQTVLQGQIGNIWTSPDTFRIDCEDEEGREAVFLYVHMIGPRSTREIVVSHPLGLDAAAKVEIAAFEEQPAEVLTAPGEATFPFTIPETVVVKCIRQLLRRSA